MPMTIGPGVDMETTVESRYLAPDALFSGALSEVEDLDSLSSPSTAESIHITHPQQGGVSLLPLASPPYLEPSAASSAEASKQPSEAAPEIVVRAIESHPYHGSRGEAHHLSAMEVDFDDASPDDGDAELLDSVGKGAIGSFASSLSAMTEVSDTSSLSSADSSKATTPAAVESGHRDTQTDQAAKPPLYRHSIERLNFAVGPKSSIPANIASYQYAGECIEAAESSRLNPYALHPEEYNLLRHHISYPQVTTYLNIRNSILRIWMRHPWTAVSRHDAIGCANARWFDAASVCFDWLVRRGYINFGCVKSLPQASTMEPIAPQAKKQRTVVVVGAGISGLACARQLEGLFKQYADYYHKIGEEPPRVMIVEGRNRVGGRVYSREFKSRPVGQVQPELPAKRHTAEMGGMIITGFDRGNPMNVIVRAQLGLPYHVLRADTTIYDSNGKPVDSVRDELVEKLYNDCLDRVSEFKLKAQPSKLIEGNRDLMNEGRDSPSDGTKSIAQAEEAAAALPHAPPVSQLNVPEKVDMVPVSSDKLTGRVHNVPGVPAILKAAEKAKLMGWNLKSGITGDQDIQLGNAAHSQGATLGSVLDQAIAQYKTLVDLTAQDHRLLNWHVANLEYSNAANLHNLSLGLWDIDAGNEWEGHHTMVVGGYQSVARGLLQCPSMLKLTTKFAVKQITYQGHGSSGPALVEAEDGSTIEADYVVCTVPLGVLKQGTMAFDPPLPPCKTGVIERLGFGILNKVVLVYQEVFWEAKRHIFGVVRDAANRHSTAQKDYAASRGRFFQWFNVTSSTGLPCLIALMAGDAGYETEHSSNNHLISEATGILRAIFGRDIPYPVEAVVTRWGSDRFARGSYSSAGPEMLPDDYDTMAKPVGNLFFAGEHTIGTHPATVHGAYLSGLRAASEVLEAMIGPIQVPKPLILTKDSLLLHKRKEAAKDPKQARLEAYEMEVWDYIRLQIGERPARPSKVSGNAYLLYSKANFDEARRRCEQSRKPGRVRSAPNEVRVMTSRMWRDATLQERKPFEDQATQQKKAYANAMQIFNQASQAWDQKAATLRKAYEEEHPFISGPAESSQENDYTSHKHRRAKHVSYAENGRMS
ncbi:hypothetical protein CDD81_6344 [Ophiocordyceps australis]|uniref:SWIRM domain-containing protein n=1 Tax=Ophiocordyceps australis TaxID=1399860 RepID=A0A2C5Y5W0_9HYPO|nr:hypothetical protein CDD81_6344 [Ophiocordyceps australis]